MSAIRNIYKVARSVLFSAIITVAAIYLILYVVVSTPFVQKELKAIAESELTKLTGGEVEIGNLKIMPFNEVVVEGLRVKTPDGEECLRVRRLGAGINLTRLLTGGEIELTYGEIIGLDGRISQEREGGRLNIQFIIDAFSPKDKNKPKKKIDLKLRNVVLRQCRLQYDKKWIQPMEGEERIDFNHIILNDLKGDLAFPEIKNDDFTIDVRRLAFNISGKFFLEKLALRAHVTPRQLTLENIVIALPETELLPSDIKIDYQGYGDIVRTLTEEPHSFQLVENKVTPADFKGIMPALGDFHSPLMLSLNVYGDGSSLVLTELRVDGGADFDAEVAGVVTNLKKIDDSEISLDKLWIDIGSGFSKNILTYLPHVPLKVREILSHCGDITLAATAHAAMEGRTVDLDCNLNTACGNLIVSGSCKGVGKGYGIIKGEVITDNLNVARLLGRGMVGEVNANIVFNSTVNGRNIDGDASLYVSGMDLNGTTCDGIAVEVSKTGKDVSGSITMDNAVALCDITADGVIDGEMSKADLRCAIGRFNPSLTGLFGNNNISDICGNLTATLSGNDIDNIRGEVEIRDFGLKSAGRQLTLDELSVVSSQDDERRLITVKSDWVEGDIEGKYNIKDLPGVVRGILGKTLPALFAVGDSHPQGDTDLEFSFLINPDNALPEYLNLPVRLLVPVALAGTIRESDSSATLGVDIPYIQQGKNKLVRDSRVNLSLNGDNSHLGLELATIFPAKKGDLALDLRVWGEGDDVYADVGLRSPDNDKFKGMLSLGAKISRDELTSSPEVNIDINPSIFDIGPSRWHIDKGKIIYDDKVLTVDNFKLWHDRQFVAIDGVASSNPEDSVSVRLADIDLDYVFDLLKINYVTFGGSATGDITGKSVFSGNPIASTDNLCVKGLSYNGAVLGDGYIRSRWDNDSKAVAIGADIRHEGQRRALIDGGIWVTRDSLSFDIAADKVPVDFLKPFMSAFTSDVKGKASGKAKLFGTFKDIDLTGRLYADSIAMKLDFTNTWYHGSDSVYLDPGHIVIPSFRLYDRNGNSALLTGDLTHEYFHDPRFTFRISDARRLLCYDTNSKMNPDWYGTIYGNGGAVVRGWPGTVIISVDMDIVNKSAFTFVLNDTQAAEDYHFLTFSDKKKEELERQRRDSVPDVLAAFRKQIETQNSTPSKFSLDIRASVNPSALMTLVMDPVAGDKITARGNGAIQIEYESDSEEMLMFGKYTLDEGNYNFSLQDLILRDFSIRPGSSISFNGDPLNADLNITASYRVNTNLSDLDKSFSTDKDLARTNVPVDAMLMVTGEMQHPDITFDIELPTLTQDVERKVKSIVSTDDMMSRQIIYLLALNRFYTPEYMGATGNGGELASVASSTLSSQLSNMLGQLTDKFTLSPSFRSEKGDFSDLEVDVALSSRLLNNRLLVNGNFGYRDRSTSSTTFVGDFDIEYLLSRNGNLRLKAYNHFNDQNYYLREALTTQGIGVVYRRDFDNLFSFLRKKKKEEEARSSGGEEEPEETDVNRE